MMRLCELRTPALVLDRGKLHANLGRMQARAADLGVALRPHLKTAKCAEIAKLAVDGQPGGVTVSTLAEIDFLLQAGFRDFTYGVGITADKLADVADLQARGARIGLVVDDPATALAVAERARSLNRHFSLHIEIDCGQHRAGTPADGDDLLLIATIIAESSELELLGVLTHAGHSYGCDGTEAITEVARAERDAANAAAQRLRDDGHACPVVSVGSTPTALFADHLEGVSEFRPGVYMFMDLFQVGLGCGRLQDIAVSVLSSVVARGSDVRPVLIDAGALALSQDVSARAFAAENGYGRICDAASGAPLDGSYIASVNQEHGFLAPEGLPADLAVGDRLRVLPNHACMTAAMYEAYHVVDGDDVVSEVWPRCRGW